MINKTDFNHLLGSTACWTAAVRAEENKREDALFRDPWAAALAGETGAAWLAQRAEGSTLPILLRTKYFDDFLQKIVQEYPVRQVVLMAAGMDTRAFRLNWPAETQIYEIDQPGVLQEKEAVLTSMGAQPTCDRRVVAQDLTGAWSEKLLQAGFQAQQASLWLLEGFLFYLPNDQVCRILEEASRLASAGSWMGFDVVNSFMLTNPYTRGWVEMQADSGAPWVGTMDDPVGTLAGLGWRAALTQAGQPDAHYGRWVLPVLPTDMPAFPHNWLVTAQKIKNSD